MQAEQFQKKGRSLRNQMWWQNCRMKLIVLFAVLMLGLVIFLLVCFAGKNCLKKN
jgi:vesicle-associated membrane protein 72